METLCEGRSSADDLPHVDSTSSSLESTFKVPISVYYNFNEMKFVRRKLY